MFPYVLILPASALVFAVALYPMFYAFHLSLHESALMVTGEFVGFENYWRLISDPASWWNMTASLIFVAGSVFLAVGLGLALALLLNQRIAFRTTFRTGILVPWVVSQVVAAMVWRWLLNADYGPVSMALLDLGLPRLDPLGDPRFAMAALILTNVWRSVAFPMILLLAALQGIPENLYRAARVDGVSWFTTLTRVTIPMLRPTLLVCVIVLTLSDFNIVALPLVLTGGGPLDSTDLISLRLYREAFTYFNMDTASAIAIILFFVNVLLTFAYLASMRGRR
ncbi:carbohydrate ABC transporter permease [Pseudohoeflea coraliihabitans]|uniref:Sugar ABC transporter permease n=1 Tax=Pseudohoeflea coraliihabitans TaxID=2860393 RepID=A0ABS6WN35_9HYPH|nr:sugar ABC transporter permease [Pseudohoeflea sp. DP4N28-3]MBW3097205.1 sugar ABC transporter permease [Pseudohoeflea sp. DP4N28-3]